MKTIPHPFLLKAKLSTVLGDQNSHYPTHSPIELYGLKSWRAMGETHVGYLLSEYFSLQFTSVLIQSL